MKKEYDFSKGVRGPVIPQTGNKTRITIRIDNDILDWFRDVVTGNRGGSYQALINDALRGFIASKGDRSEDRLRKVIREELAAYRAKKKR